MDLAVKKNQSFRLPLELINRLKEMAKGQNRSLNNFVETLLLDAAYHEPNAVTRAAMREAESGELRDAPAIDLTSIQSMEKSLGL
ncbi:MAG: toxin-antitoxin system protein [Muribaculaceae bacterium]|nr:toxin-antitoxin system protein [Muribaculaceae bacterium]